MVQTYRLSLSLYDAWNPYPKPALKQRHFYELSRKKCIPPSLASRTGFAGSICITAGILISTGKCGPSSTGEKNNGKESEWDRKILSMLNHVCWNGLPSTNTCLPWYLESFLWACQIWLPKQSYNLTFDGVGCWVDYCFQIVMRLHT